LERYYLVAGQSDPIVITMPKGGYAPIFTPAERPAPPPEAEPAPVEPNHRIEGDHERPRRLWLWLTTAGVALTAVVVIFYGRTTPPTTQQPPISPSEEQTGSVNSPRILVEPFEDLSGTADSKMIALGLTDEVIAQLSKFKEITVIGADPSDRDNNAFVHRYGAPRYVLEGRVRTDGTRLRLTARFLNRLDGSVIWANSYDRTLRVQELLDVQSDVATGVATALAQPYGIIFQTDATHFAQSPPDDWDAYACTLAYYSYRSDLDPQRHASVQTCLERATQKFPEYSTFWALLSLTYLDEFRFRFRVDWPAARSLDLAYEAAERAVNLDPHNGRALQAQMLAYFLRGQVDTALKVGALAVAINPNDTELTAEYAFRLALSGQWHPGCDLMSEAMARNPTPKRYFEAALSLCYYMKNDYATAEKWARTADLQKNPIARIILLAILGAAGKSSEATEERRWLENNAPQILRDVRREVETRIYLVQDQEHFLDGLRASGLTVPERSVASASGGIQGK
jgi:TolB-like protein